MAPSCRSAEAMFGYAERELVGRPLSVVLPNHHALVQPRCQLIQKKVRAYQPAAELLVC